MSQLPLAIAAKTPADYQRLGIPADHIATWEDGARTDNSKGTYEWWYFDAHLDDGAKLVIVFMNKDITTPNRPLDPLIRLNLDLANGESYSKLVQFAPGQWSAETDHADVRIAGNRFTGDLHSYRITVSLDDITVDATLTGTVAPWRPQTGYLLFGADRTKEFAWLPSVPQGTVRAEYRIDGETHTATGIGYHDHNWGNAGLVDVIHDWYWARGTVGPYTVIASYITAHERYDYEAIPVFMLARDGIVLAEDATEVRFEAEGVYTDPLTGKPVASVTRYTYDDRYSDERYVVTFRRERDLARERMIDGVKGVKRLLATAARFDGAYLRFTGDCIVQRFLGDTLVEVFDQPAIWELMYFGHAR
jgi:hypothetical protein